MDNEFKELEDALKRLTPKEPSEGARWNLARRLEDLEEVETKRLVFPRFAVVASVAATILVALLIWIVVGHNKGPGTQERVVDGPEERPNAVNKVVGSELVPSTVEEGQMEFIGEEERYPSTIAFELERRATGVEDLGIVRIADQPLMRKIRKDYVRELLLTDPETGKTYPAQKTESKTILIRVDNE